MSTEPQINFQFEKTFISKTTKEYLRGKATSQELKEILNLAFAKKFIKAVDANLLIQRLLEAIIIDNDLEEEIISPDKVNEGKEKESVISPETVKGNPNEETSSDPLSQDQSLTQVQKILQANEKVESLFLGF